MTDRMDATAAAQLEEEVTKPVFLAFLDFANEPIRVNSAAENFDFSGSGDADLDGHTFYGLDADLAEVSPVRFAEGGTETVKATLSALIDLDNDMLNEIGDNTNWQGRTARLWRMIRNADNVQQGALQNYYTGYMVDLSIQSSPERQVIDLSIEGFIAAHSRASNRSYLDQEKYDSGDLSAKAAISIANGTSGNPITNNTGVGVGGGGIREPGIRYDLL